MLRLNTLYRGVARCSLGEGSTVLFWNDSWSQDILAQNFPMLFSFARLKDASVKQIMLAQDLESIFHLPLTQEAYHELTELQDYLQLIPYQEDENDQWSFIWGSHSYTSNRMYKFVSTGPQAPQTFKLLWKAKSMPRIKFFAWLMLMDRLNTKDMLQRRNSNVQAGVNCVLCHGSIRETRDHLFFDCLFVKHCWELINITLDDHLDIHGKILATRHHSGLSFFMDVFLIASWEI